MRVPLPAARITIAMFRSARAHLPFLFGSLALESDRRIARRRPVAASVPRAAQLSAGPAGSEARRMPGRIPGRARGAGGSPRGRGASGLPRAGRVLRFDRTTGSARPRRASTHSRAASAAEGTSIQIFGNTHGLKAHQVRQLERLSRRRDPAGSPGQPGARAGDDGAHPRDRPPGGRAGRPPRRRHPRHGRAAPDPSSCPTGGACAPVRGACAACAASTPTSPTRG